MRLVYALITLFLLLAFFFTRWYLCTVRHLCEFFANAEIAMMIVTGVIVGFTGAWLLSEKTFRILRSQLGGLLKERTGLHKQLRLLEKENESARRHVSEWQQKGSLLSEVKKVTEPLLQQAKHQVDLLEQELKQYQRRYDDLKEETEGIRKTADQLRSELTLEREREKILQEEVDSKREAEAQPLIEKLQKIRSRFTPSTWQAKDDLALISGIGPVIQKKLNELGIYTFQQIAEFTPADIEMVTSSLKVFKGRIGKDNWIGQAAALRIK